MAGYWCRYENDKNNNDNIPERWDGDAGEAEDKVKAGEDGEPKEPEPQEEEHLHGNDCQARGFLKKKKGLTFSLTMLSERIQRLLNFCSPAAVPTEWKVQL